MKQRRISQLCQLIVWDVRCAACRGAVSLYIVPDALRRAVARTMKISPYDWLCLECLTGCIKPDASVDDLPDLIQSIESLTPPLPNDTVPFKGIAIACTSTDLPSITAVEAKKDDPRIYRHMVIFAQGTSWHQQTSGAGARGRVTYLPSAPGVPQSAGYFFLSSSYRCTAVTAATARHTESALDGFEVA